MFRLRDVALALSALALASCIQGGLTGPVDPEMERRLSLIPLEDGKTTREDIVLAYGIPSVQLEGDRILAYRLQESGEGVIVVPREFDIREPQFARWKEAGLNLILVFDERSILKRHRLLRIRQSPADDQPDPSEKSSRRKS